jgi:hypothetical protein
LIWRFLVKDNKKKKSFMEQLCAFIIACFTATTQITYRVTATSAPRNNMIYFYYPAFAMISEWCFRVV